MHGISNISKKRTYFSSTYFVVTKRFLGTFADCFISELVFVRLPLFTCGMTSLLSNISRLYSPDWWLVISCKHYSLWSTTKESEINILWRLLLTWHFTSPCVNQIFNQKLDFVYYGIYVLWMWIFNKVCMMFQEMPVCLICRKSFGTHPSLLHVFFSAIYWCVMVLI